MYVISYWPLWEAPYGINGLCIIASHFNFKKERNPHKNDMYVQIIS